MSLGTGLKHFADEYPDRFFDVGIAEEHAVPFALGLAKGNMVPVFVVYSTFLQRCYDQLLHDCALQESKMIIAVDRAGVVGECLEKTRRSHLEICQWIGRVACRSKSGRQ